MTSFLFSRSNLYLIIALIAFISVINGDARKHMIKNVPYHRQITEYACGAASLQMVMDYHQKTSIDQFAIMDVARTNDNQGTMTYDMIRTGHFSKMSIAASNNFPGQDPQLGFKSRPIGYAAFPHFAQASWLEQLKDIIDQNIPIAILSQYGYNDTGGHYRVVVGYDDDTKNIYLNDPWNRSPDPREVVNFNYTYFEQLWNYQEKGSIGKYFGVLLMPWTISASVDKEVDALSKNVTATLTVSATYPCVKPFDCKQFPAENTIINVQLPSGVVLVKGQKKSVNVGSVFAGNTVKANFKLVIPEQAAVTKTLTGQVSVQGLIKNSVAEVPGKYNELFPAYDYVDAIGGTLSFTL